MTDPVEVIARAIADLWWRTGNQVPIDIARAALAALEGEGLVVVRRPPVAEEVTYRYDAASNEVRMFQRGVYVGTVPD
jgi:hypothetical protein